MTSQSIATAAYIVASLLFILSLAGLSTHETSRQGVLFGIGGMAIALAATFSLVANDGDSTAVILLLIAVAVLGPGIINLMIMIGLITWTIPCRIVRGQFLLLRESDFATAARVVGLSDTAIVTKHILPNATAPLLVFLSLGVASAVLIEAGLSYLGLGVQPPTPSWGNMLNAARSITTLEQHPWEWVPPAVFTVVFVLSVNFVGDGLRDALDPRGSKDG
jgi:peptide/nickel transport system permease protein